MPDRQDIVTRKRLTTTQESDRGKWGRGGLQSPGRGIRDGYLKAFNYRQKFMQAVVKEVPVKPQFKIPTFY